MICPTSKRKSSQGRGTLKSKLVPSSAWSHHIIKWSEEGRQSSILYFRKQSPGGHQDGAIRDRSRFSSLHIYCQNKFTIRALPALIFCDSVILLLLNHKSSLYIQVHETEIPGKSEILQVFRTCIPMNSPDTPGMERDSALYILEKGEKSNTCVGTISTVFFKRTEHISIKKYNLCFQISS